MFCTRCGAQIGDSARFCSSCGRSTEPGAENGAFHASAYAGPARKLRRLTHDKKIAGVCAGFAEYFDTDVSLMRVIWLGLLLIPPNIGFPAYIISWIVLPKD